MRLTPSEQLTVTKSRNRANISIKQKKQDSQSRLIGLQPRFGGTERWAGLRHGNHFTCATASSSFGEGKVVLSSCGRVPTRGPSSKCSLFHSSPSSVIRRGHGGWGVPGLITSYDIQPGDGVGLFEAPEPTRDTCATYCQWWDRQRTLATHTLCRQTSTTGARANGM